MTKSFSEISARYRLRSGTVCALRTGARCVQSQPYCLATTRPERRRCQGCGRSPHPKGMALKTPECRAPSRSSRRADRRSCGSSPSRRVTITTSNPVITLSNLQRSSDFLALNRSQSGLAKIIREPKTPPARLSVGRLEKPPSRPPLVKLRRPEPCSLHR